LNTGNELPPPFYNDLEEYRMTWKEWLKYGIYKKLWSLTPINRPFTYWLRDTWHRLEGIWIIGLVAIGALLGHWLWDLIFWFLLVFALGYIAGHLFWGKEYIPNQRGE